MTGFVVIGPLAMVIGLTLAPLVLGPKRLLQAARDLGTGMRELRDSLAGREVEDSAHGGRGTGE